MRIDAECRASCLGAEADVKRSDTSVRCEFHGRVHPFRLKEQPQMLKQDPEMGIQRLHHHLRVDVRLPLAPWWSAGVCPEVNLSAVIDHGEAGLSHWAHRHQAKADFHDRSTFLKG